LFLSLLPLFPFVQNIGVGFDVDPLERKGSMFGWEFRRAEVSARAPTLLSCGLCFGWIFFWMVSLWEMMNRSIFWICVAAFAFGTPLFGQEDAGWLEKYAAKVWESDQGGTLNYQVRVPDALEAGKKYPLVLLLHGAGGRGDDNKGQIVDAGGGAALDKMGISGAYGAYVMAGQVPNEKQWVDVPWSTLDHEMPKASDSMRMMLEALVAFVSDEKNQVDTERIYVVGLSMGGYGTWDAIQRRPELFAAAVPICGGGDKRLAGKIAKLPIWAWHGEADPVIKVSRSRDMVAALREAGGTPKYTEVPGRGHNVWVDAFGSEELWRWLFLQRKERGMNDDQKKAKEAAAAYRSFEKITPEPVSVDPKLARFCRGANERELKEAAKRNGPHAHSAVTIFMNELATKAYRGRSTYPEGAVIVKEKFKYRYLKSGGMVWPNDGVGGMLKRENGYAPEQGDWQFIYFEDMFRIETGKMASCVDCHKNAEAKDFVFGDWGKRDVEE
jgi:dienelactone hydrolase